MGSDICKIFVDLNARVCCLRDGNHVIRRFMPATTVKDRTQLAFVDMMHEPELDLDTGEGLEDTLAHYEQAADLTSLRWKLALGEVLLATRESFTPMDAVLQVVG